MESIFPVFLVCIMPLVLLAAAFLAGRWSVKYDVRIERRGHIRPQAPAHPAYQDYYEEQA